MTPGQKKLALAGVVAVAVGIGVVLIKPGAQAVLPSFEINTAPYTHNMMAGAYSPLQVAYSGRHLVHIQQWGAFIANVDVGGASFRMISPVATYFMMQPCWPSSVCFQPAQHRIVGDCHQSGSNVAASPGAEKWVIVTGTSDMCLEVGQNKIPGQLQVMRLDGPAGFRYVGQVYDTRIPRLTAQPTLDGDFAYVAQDQIGPTRYMKIDLNTLTVTASDLTGRPAWTPQPNIDGYTYTMFPKLPTPLPQPFAGPAQFTLTRQGSGVTPPPPTATAVSTPPPQSSPTKTPLPAATCLPTRVVTVVVTASKTPSLQPAATKTKTPSMGPNP